MQTEARRGYTQVGKQLFAVDTRRLKLNRVKSGKITKRTRSAINVARAQADGPYIIDHDDNVNEGLGFTVPKGFYQPLRSLGKSEAQSVYGGSNKRLVKFRNPKSYIPKHGDMAQKFEIRRTEVPEHERYLGTDCYVDMFKTLELEAHAVKNCVTLPKTKYIARPEKGSELPPKAIFVYRKDPTEYKQVFTEQGNPKDYQFAGKPYKHTPIGEW
jgi:hypothetical protein